MSQKPPPIATTSQPTKACLDCAMQIPQVAKKCPYCQEWQDDAERKRSRNAQHATANAVNGALSAVLSIFVPGLGHMIAGDFGSGAIWFVVVLALYGWGAATSFTPILLAAFCLHVYVVISAFKYANNANR